jgi:hypothetical protein
MWYGESPFQIYNDVDRAFYESIKLCLSIKVILRVFNFPGLCSPDGVSVAPFPGRGYGVPMKKAVPVWGRRC